MKCCRCKKEADVLDNDKTSYCDSCWETTKKNGDKK